jgi:hypothetical protein
MAKNILGGDIEHHDFKGYPEDLVIDGLGPCVGVMVYDAESRTAIATHLASPDIHQVAILLSMLDQARNAYASSNSVFVYVSGACSQHGRGIDAETREKRQFVGQAVTNALPNATQDVRWPGPGILSTSMLINENGECHFGPELTELPDEG